MTKRKSGDHPDLKMVNANAAAIDVGSTMHMAAVNPDTDIERSGSCLPLSSCVSFDLIK